MKEPHFNVKKSSGAQVKFSLEKLRASLSRSGASEKQISQILNVVRDELYQGISTLEIYNRAFALLKKEQPVFASKYKLKKALYELGPTGFPFERLMGQILYYSGYDVQIGVMVDGKCVQHEVDVIASIGGDKIFIECKFHGEEGRKCDVKIPLYIHSRYLDIVNQQFKGVPSNTQGWVVTNTRFTSDAVAYGTCAGLKLLSWDYPKGNGLKDRIDQLGLYPITVSTLLSKREKDFLLSRDVVLCKQLLKNKFYLDHLGMSDSRKAKILNEINMLCNDKGNTEPAN